MDNQIHICSNSWHIKCLLALSKYVSAELIVLFSYEKKQMNINAGLHLRT